MHGIIATALAGAMLWPGLMTNAQTIDRPPTLLVQTEEGAPPVPVAIESCAIDVVIHGFLAKTTTTLTFRNDLDRILEGRLFFPVPDRSAVSGYAIDVGGELVDAVPVERTEARVAFESEVRKGIDPGLLEWQRGNNFQLRIWPLPARGERTVRVEYITQLASLEDGGRFMLPLHFEQEMERFEMRIEVLGADGENLPFVEPNDRFDMTFDVAKGRAMAEVVRENMVADRSIILTIPQMREDDAWSVFVEDFGDDPFTYVAALGPPRPLPRKRGIVKPHPGVIGIVWDASLSTKLLDRSKEYELVENVIRQFDMVSVEVTIVRDKAEPPKRFEIRDKQEDVAAVIEYLKDAEADGGTDFSGVRFRDRGEVGWYLLFTDANFTMNDALPPLEDAHVYAISNGKDANHTLLRHIAHKSGGEYFNLDERTVEDAATLIGAEAINDGVAAAPEHVDSAWRAGRHAGDRELLALRFRSDDRDAEGVDTSLASPEHVDLDQRC